MKLGSTGYESHPAADLFPMMDEVALTALADDIEANGLREPVVLLDGLVLDGRNRLLACEMTTRDPRFERWSGEGSPTAWVLSKNLHRRHLTDTDRKLIAAEAAKLYEAEAAARRRSTQNNASASSVSADLREQGKATEKAARDLGVSTRGVEQAKRVIEQAPVLAEAVRAGKASLDAAAQLADEPAEVQRELVAAGPQAIRKAAAGKRAESKLSEEERRRIQSLLDNAAPPSDGMAFAFMAIEQLKQIRKDDSERSKAFAHVHQWLRDHEN